MKGRLLLLGIVSVITVLVVFGAPAAGTAPPGEEINETYGTSDSDGFNDIIPTEDGNYLLIGWDGPDPGNGTVRKVAPDGTVLWKRSYGEQESTFLGGIQTSDGGYALAGWTNTGGNIDGWVVKINATGEQQWENTFGGNNSDWFEDIEETPDGNLLVVGTSISDANGDEAWVVKTQADGSAIWNFVFWQGDQAGDENFFAIERTPSDTFLLAGQEYRQSGDWDGIAFELDRQGEILWSGAFGHSILDDWFDDVAVTDSGQAYFVGARNAIWNASNGVYDRADAWVLAVNESRGVSWSTTVSVGDYNNLDAVDTDSNRIVVSGFTQANGGIGGDGVAILLNSDGGETWNTSVGGNQVDDFDGIVIGSQNSYYVAGSTESFDFGDSDGWLVKLSDQNQGEKSALQAIAGDDNIVDFTEVLQAISAFNTGSTINGYQIGFQDVLDAISAFNTGEKVN